ncbi:hypothetical protein EYS14_17645 [Alteromonadaceae bacterium M269]|nr:hypothetical protein EYS14_17645 [Alteromonadaceae bacterium M269]
MSKTLALILFALSSLPALSSETSAHDEHHLPHGRHHISVFLGTTDLEGNTGFTQGIDYEYRINGLIGLGGVAEYALGGIEAWTILAVADIHLKNGLILQVGPGFEHGDEEDVFVTRFGALYEFEFGKYTISPQVHFDDHTGSEDAVVYGIAFGFSF